MKWSHGFVRRLAPGTAAILFALGTVGSAQANVIAVSIDTITVFNFSGGGVVTQAPLNSSGSDSANFTGFATASNSASCPAPPGPCNPGGLSANPVQATSGAGPFPGQDVYTQPPAGGFVGSRGDANVTSVDFNGPNSVGAQNVAETRLSPGATGGANGTNHIATTVNINIPSGTTQAITFTFTADPFMQVAVDQAGENAVANLTATISLTQGGATPFLWMPDALTSNDVGVASQTNPFSLNQTLDINSPAGNTTFNPAAGNFMATSVGLGPGTYTLNLDVSETVRGVQSQGAVIPEPASLLLLLAGLAGLAGARKADVQEVDP
jgi:hypothetical protein